MADTSIGYYDDFDYDICACICCIMDGNDLDSWVYDDEGVALIWEERSADVDHCDREDSWYVRELVRCPLATRLSSTHM